MTSSARLYVSASEIETFDLCRRKWAFVYIEGKRPPPNDSAALGTRVHSILEKWLRDGIAPDTWTVEGEIAASGLHLLPPPKFPGLVTEHAFHFTSARAWYTGFKDFRYRDANGLLHVGDHKTTKSFTWAKTLDEILGHPQALIYAVDEFRQSPEDTRLSLDWIYYKTQGSKKAEPRFQIVTREQVADMFFHHVDPVAGEITRIHDETPPGTSALNFNPDFRACDAYGGCAFLSVCNPTATQRVQANMTQAGLSLTEKLRSMAAQRAAAPSPVHPPEALPGALPPPAPVAPAPFVPPAFAPPPQAPVAPPAASPLAAAMGARFDLPVPSAPAPVAPVVSAAPAFAPPAPPAPKTRGRPKASAPSNAPEVIDEDETAGVPAAPQRVSEPGYPLPVPPPLPGTNPVALVTADSRFTLYIGCAPIGVDITNALDYLNLAHDQLRETHKVAHYRAIPYGEGAAALCAALEYVFDQCAQTGTQPAGDVYLGDTPIEHDTASVWIGRASKIVRAFR